MAGRRGSPPEAPAGLGTTDVEARMELSTSTPTVGTSEPSPGLETGDRKEGRHKPEGHPNSGAWHQCPPTQGPPSVRSIPATGD